MLDTPPRRLTRFIYVQRRFPLCKSVFTDNSRGGKEEGGRFAIGNGRQRRKWQSKGRANLIRWKGWKGKEIASTTSISISFHRRQRERQKSRRIFHCVRCLAAKVAHMTWYGHRQNWCSHVLRWNDSILVHCKPLNGSLDNGSYRLLVQGLASDWVLLHVKSEWPTTRTRADRRISEQPCLSYIDMVKNWPVDLQKIVEISDTSIW